MNRPTITAGYYTASHGERCRLDLQAELRPVSHSAAMTDHERGHGLALSISGDVIETKSLRDAGGGQCVDELRALLRDPDANLKADRALLADILAVWETYHLNDMTPGCVHQGPEWLCTKLQRDAGGALAYCNGGPAPTRNGWPVVRRLYGTHPHPHHGDECHVCGRFRWDEPSDHCPETGYRYGTSWLVKPLPEAVVMLVRELWPTIEA